MARAGIAELKASLSAYLRRVAAGEEVIVTDRGRPIARISAVAHGAGPSDDDAQRLVAAGVLLPPTRADRGGLLAELRALQRPEGTGVGIVDALLEERDTAP